MNIRDVKSHTLRRMAIECEEEFDEWFGRTGARHFSTKEPLTPQDIWRYAYSKGSSAVLRRVDSLKENT
jgi:hypothetical protein